LGKIDEWLGGLSKGKLAIFRRKKQAEERKKFLEQLVEFRRELDEALRVFREKDR